MATSNAPSALISAGTRAAILEPVTAAVAAAAVVAHASAASVRRSSGLVSWLVLLCPPGTRVDRIVAGGRAGKITPIG